MLLLFQTQKKAIALYEKLMLSVDSDRFTINRQFGCVKLATRIHVVALLEGMECGL